MLLYDVYDDYDDRHDVEGFNQLKSGEVGFLVPYFTAFLIYKLVQVSLPGLLPSV